MKIALLGSIALLLVFSHFLTAAVADGIVTVPEPLSMTSMGLALASLAGYKIYRKRK